jgi:hypothetical protein
LELFFDEMIESSYNEFFPEVYSSFAEAMAFRDSPNQQPRPAIAKDSIMEPMSNWVKGITKEDKIVKLEKRFSDRPNQAGSPLKAHIQSVKNGCKILFPLVSSTYSSFFQEIETRIEKYALNKEKFLLDFLLIIDSYQFIRNSYLIVGEKVALCKVAIKNMPEANFGKDAEFMEKFKRKYVEAYLALRIWGFLLSLEQFNFEKFNVLQNHSEKLKQIFEEEFRFDCWVDWAFLDIFLTYSFPYMSEQEQARLLCTLKACPFKIFRQEIAEKLERRQDTIILADAPMEKHLEDHISEIIYRVHSVSITSTEENPNNLSQQSSSLLMRRTIKPISLTFIPVSMPIYLFVLF